MIHDKEKLVIKNDDGSIALNYNELLDKIDPNWSEIEKARYIYIELGKFFIYDSDFVSAKDNAKREEIGSRDITDIKNNKIVCMSISRIYTELLKQCGIQSELVMIPPDKNNPKDVGHAYTKITIDGKTGSVGLIHDLTNIKIGFKTQDFLPNITDEKVKKYKESLKLQGLSDEEIDNEIREKRNKILEISQEDLREIDKKIGYTNKEGKYFDDILKEVKNTFESVRKDYKFSLLTDERWLAYQIDFIITNMGHDDLTCIEKNDYFKKAIEQCIESDNLEKFTTHNITCFDKNGKMKIFHIFEPKEKTGENKRLVYALDKDCIIPVSQEEINSELDNGLEIFSKSKYNEYYNILIDHKLENKQKIEQFSPLGKEVISIASDEKVKAKMDEAGQILEAYHEQMKNKGCDWTHDIQ